MPDWSQLIKILPAIGSMTQGGPEFEAFMQGYQQTLQLLERQKLAQREMGNREAETGLMRDRFAAQDARTTADDARQDRREQGQGIESLLSMVPGLADDATAVPPPLTVPTPFGDLPSIGALIPGVRKGAQAESVGESLRALAPMMGVEPGLVDRMGPFLRPAVSRAEAARQNRRRKAIEAAVALAEKRQDVEALQQSDADVTFEVDGQEDRLPYSKALQEAKLPPVKATPVTKPQSLEAQLASAATPEEEQRVLRKMRLQSEATRKPETGGTAKAGGRPLLGSQAAKLAELTTSLDDSAVLESVVKTGVTGTASRVGAALPNWVTDLTGWGEDAKSKQAVINRVKQVIGKALEGGVLRREDEYKYKEILPTIGDPAEIASNKVRGLIAAIRQRRERELEALEDAGYNTSRFRERLAGPMAGASGSANVKTFNASQLKPKGGQ